MLLPPMLGVRRTASKVQVYGNQFDIQETAAKNANSRHWKFIDFDQQIESQEGGKRRYGNRIFTLRFCLC